MSTAAAPAAAAGFTLTVRHDGLARTLLVHRRFTR
jgi:hypothetical protein